MCLMDRVTIFLRVHRFKLGLLLESILQRVVLISPVWIGNLLIHFLEQVHQIQTRLSEPSALEKDLSQFFKLTLSLILSLVICCHLTFQSAWDLGFLIPPEVHWKGWLITRLCVMFRHGYSTIPKSSQTSLRVRRSVPQTIH